MMWQTNRYFLREGDSMNYMIKGIQALKESFFLGIIIYIVTDCFIEIIYTADQTIKFENAENFSIERADRLLYNADKNVLYWGEAGYQNCLDYTKMNEEMQAHKEEILKGYEELSTSIRDCFNQ